MARMLPRLSAEPPAAYVAFVERHLGPLRRDAARITGDERDAGEIYSPALTDVAVRWRRFELIKSVLGRPDPAGAFLKRAVARRTASWHDPDGDGDPHIEVWSADRPPPRVGRAPDRQTPPTRVSAAVRIARARQTPLATASAAAEAGIAWWHAYEAHVRHRRIAGAALALIGVMLMYRLELSLNV